MVRAFPWIAACAVLLLLAWPARAQDAQRTCGDPIAESSAPRKPCHVDASIFTAAEQPSIFSDLKIRATDLLEASLSVENKGGSITYAPLLYGLAEYRPILSELRFRASQKDNLTTVGTGLQYNPLNPRGARGARLWTEVAGGGSTPPLYTLRTRLAQDAAAREKQLRELEEAYRRASTLPPGATPPQLEDMRKEQAAIAAKIAELQGKISNARQEIASIEAAEAKRTQELVQAFYQRFLTGGRPLIGATYSLTLFSTLGGSRVDANNNNLNDLEHRLKQHAFAATVDSRLSERLQVSALAGREWVRASAEEGTDFAHTFAAGVTVGGIVTLLDKAYRESTAYRESLFIPSVVVGGSIEHRRCTNGDARGVTCPDKLERLTVLTPFADLKVTKTTQLRIGTPLRFSRPAGGGSGKEIGVVTAFTLQLGEPK